MSALQTIPFPQQRQSADDLLASATKSTKPGRLTMNDPFASQQAALWLQLDRQVKDLEAEQSMARDALIDAVKPFHEKESKRRRTYDSSVYVPSEFGDVRVSFQHKWSKIRHDQEPGLREVFPRYDELFRRQVSVKLRKEISEDAEQLQAVVLELAHALGGERFRAIFEVEQSIAPTKLFTESQYNFTEHQRNCLGLASVRQVLLVAKGGRE